MTRDELRQELKLMKEKTEAVIGQFSICCELLLSRLEDIDRCQEYIMHQVNSFSLGSNRTKIKGNR